MLCLSGTEESRGNSDNDAIFPENRLQENGISERPSVNTCSRPAEWNHLDRSILNVLRSRLECSLLAMGAAAPPFIARSAMEPSERWRRAEAVRSSSCSMQTAAIRQSSDAWFGRIPTRLNPPSMRPRPIQFERRASVGVTRPSIRGAARVAVAHHVWAISCNCGWSHHNCRWMHCPSGSNDGEESLLERTRGLRPTTRCRGQMVRIEWRA